MDGVKRIAAQKFGVSIKVIGTVCKGNPSCICKRKKTNKPQIEETIALFEQGKTIAQISTQLGVQYSTTDTRIRSYKKRNIRDVEDDDVVGIHPCLTLFGSSVDHAI